MHSLLLSEQQHGFIDAINVNLQELVELVDLHLDSLSNLLCLLQISGIAVYHDGVCIAIDHIQVQLSQEGGEVKERGQRRKNRRKERGEEEQGQVGGPELKRKYQGGVCDHKYYTQVT